jgi:hypothetical protein
VPNISPPALHEMPSQFASQSFPFRSVDIWWQIEKLFV